MQQRKSVTDNSWFSVWAKIWCPTEIHKTLADSLQLSPMTFANLTNTTMDNPRLLAHDHFSDICEKV